MRARKQKGESSEGRVVGSSEPLRRLSPPRSNLLALSILEATQNTFQIYILEIGGVPFDSDFDSEFISPLYSVFMGLSVRTDRTVSPYGWDCVSVRMGLSVRTDGTTSPYGWDCVSVLAGLSACVARSIGL